MMLTRLDHLAQSYLGTEDDAATAAFVMAASRMRSPEAPAGVELDSDSGPCYGPSEGYWRHWLRFARGEEAR